MSLVCASPIGICTDSPGFILTVWRSFFMSALAAAGAVEVYHGQWNWSQTAQRPSNDIAVSSSIISSMYTYEENLLFALYPVANNFHVKAHHRFWLRKLWPTPIQLYHFLIFWRAHDRWCIQWLELRSKCKICLWCTRLSWFISLLFSYAYRRCKTITVDIPGDSIFWSICKISQHETNLPLKIYTL